MQEAPVSKNKAIFQTAVLVIFLGVVPFVSWYYLQKGYDYQKDLIAQLYDYGELPSFNFQNAAGKTYDTSFLKDKVAILGFLGGDEEESADRLEIIQRLHDQFDDRTDVIFILHKLEKEAVGFADLEAAGLNDMEQVFLVAEPVMSRRLLDNHYGYPDFNGRTGTDSLIFQKPIPASSKDYPFFLLKTPNQMIRSYYRVNEIEDIRQLVEHTALTMPREQKQKPKLVRESEK